MIDNSLESLADGFRDDVDSFLAELMRRRLYIVIIETWRSIDRQLKLLKLGKSRTKHSLHLIGAAIDLAPVEVFDGRVRKIQWDPSDPIWEEIGSLAESFGLEWGGRWQFEDGFRDFNHFQRRANEITSDTVVDDPDPWVQ